MAGVSFIRMLSKQVALALLLFSVSGSGVAGPAEVERLLPVIDLLLHQDQPMIVAQEARVGLGLQRPDAIGLLPAPASATDVSLTVADPAIATLSTDPRVSGSDSLRFEGVTGRTVGTVYVQGQAMGNTLLTIQAPGYPDRELAVSVGPAGIYFDTTSASVTASASPIPASWTLRSAALDPVSRAFIENQPLAPGNALMVEVGSANPYIAEVSNLYAGTFPTPVSLAEGNDSVSGNVYPITAGTTRLSISQPAGFSAPSDRPVEMPVTVNSGTTPNLAGFAFECDLGGVPAPLLTAIEVVSNTGIIWGGTSSNRTITGVVGTGDYTLYSAGLLFSSSAAYTFTGQGDFADFTNLDNYERFRVQWLTDSARPAWLGVLVNPFGPGPVTYDCQFKGSTLL